MIDPKQREEIKDSVIENLDIKGIIPNFTKASGQKVQPEYDRWIPQGEIKKPVLISDVNSITLDNSYVSRIPESAKSLDSISNENF